MISHRRPIGLAAVCAIISTLIVHPLLAEDWPTRPLTMVVTFAPGGPNDLLARIIAPRMSEILGQQIIVENVVGAGGMTGASRVARAKPDGYQFVLGGKDILAYNQTLYKNPLYNAVTDFTPVGLFAEASYVLITRNDLPVNNLQEFIGYAKENQGKMQFGSAGVGSGVHITCVLFNSVIGVQITHVPYRGSALAMQDLQGSRIDYMCDVISAALPQIQGKKVKAIATLSRERSPVLPDQATAHEQGLTDFDGFAAWAFLLPRGTPETIVRRLNKAMSDALDTPAVRERLLGFGITATPLERRTPEYLAKFIPSEIEKWARPIRASGVSMD